MFQPHCCGEVESELSDRLRASHDATDPAAARRRWITHRCSSVNHQSPLTCQCRHQHPTAITLRPHSYSSYTGNNTKSYRGGLLLMSRVKLCEKKEKKHPPSLTLLFSLSCIPLSSCTPHPSHITLLVASVPAFFCALCTMFHFSSLECPPRGTVHPQLRVVCSRGGKSLSCVLLGISLPGTLKRANHCSHFKRYWIE